VSTTRFAALITGAAMVGLLFGGTATADPTPVEQPAESSQTEQPDTVESVTATTVPTTEDDSPGDDSTETEGPDVPTVRGPRGHVTVIVFQDHDNDLAVDKGELVPNLEIRIEIPNYTQAHATLTSDADGKADFTDLQQGVYAVLVPNGWRTEPSWVTVNVVLCDSECDFFVRVVKSGTGLPTSTLAATTPAPVVQAGPAAANPDSLPDTGANVLWLAITGLATVALGVVAVIMAGRRRAKA
jgi:LPXTG-motif cell wall-anchored protein